MHINKLYLNIVKGRNFLSRMGVKPAHFSFPIFLSFCTALFDGVGVWLLIPMVKGVIAMDFSFVRNLPFFKIIISAFPQVFIHNPKANSSIFILLLGIIFVSAFLKNMFLYFSSLTTSYQANQFSKGMRDVIFSRYLSFGKLFFDRTNIGQLNTTLVSFTTRIARLLIYLRFLINSVFTLIIYFAIMCIISWKLTIFTLFLFPLLYYSLNWLTEKIKTTSKLHAESQIKEAWKIFDIFSCLPLIKSYAREKEERERFSELTSLVTQLESSNDKKILLVKPMQELVVIALLLLVSLAVVFIFVKDQTETIPSFLVFFYILKRCDPLLNYISNFKAELARAEGPIISVLQVLDNKDKFFIPEGNTDFKGVKEKIEFRNLNFSYIKTIRVLKDVTFSIEEGKMTAIVGPTGSGKTTLINLILRFYDSPPSSIFIDSIDIRDFKLDSLRNHMGVVSQDTLLFNNTIRYNITYGLDRNISNEELIEVAKKARIYDFIKTLPDEFETFIGDRGIRLSGGEKQRLSIARVLLKGSEILILDEATSSLDTKTERLIQEAIDEAIKDKTAIVIAHRLSTIKHADKIVVIEEGRFVEEGSLDELLSKKSAFYRYWQDQKFD